MNCQLLIDFFSYTVCKHFKLSMSCHAAPLLEGNVTKNPSNARAIAEVILGVRRLPPALLCDTQ